MKKNETKEQIAEVALHLFAQRGYSAVSIRDICKEVGVKESTIYYHYKNKQAIFDALLDKMNQFAEEKKSAFNQVFKSVDTVSVEEMEEVAVGVLKNYLLHPVVFPIISILTIERMYDPKAGAEYRRIVFDMPLEQQKQVFREMICRKIVKEEDAMVFADLYYGIIFAAFQQYCIGCQPSQANIQCATEQIRRNINYLYRSMKG